MLQSSSPKPTFASFLSADTIPIISSLLFSTDRTSPSSTAPITHTENHKCVTFAEPEEATASNDSHSQSAHNAGVTGTQEKSRSAVRNTDDTQVISVDGQNTRNKADKLKTTYSLAYPHRYFRLVELRLQWSDRNLTTSMQ